MPGYSKKSTNNNFFTDTGMVNNNFFTDTGMVLRSDMYLSVTISCDVFQDCWELNVDGVIEKKISKLC